MPTDFDAVLQEVGEFGRYQKLVVWLLCVPTCFVNAFNGFVFVFQAYTPAFGCNVAPFSSSPSFNSTTSVDWSLNQTLWSGNGTNVSSSNTVLFDDQCYYDHGISEINGTVVVSECQNFHYDQQYFRRTLITEFDLVCDRAIIWKNMLSFLNAVSIAGCFIYSYVQDRWGRKPCFLLSLAAYLFGGTASLFAGNPMLFTVLRAPWALSGVSTWNIGYIWALEYVGPSKRAYVSSVMNLLYGVAAVFLALLAWFSYTWVQLGLITTVPFVLLFTYYFVIDESPRWLITQGRREEAARTLQKMAKWDRAPPLSEEVLDKLLSTPSSNDGNDHQQLTVLTKNTGKRDHDDDDATIDEKIDNKRRDKSREGFALFQLFRQRNIRWKTALITYAWISVVVVYNSIAYNVENLGGNLYWTYVLQAAVEIPANVLVLPALNRFGRLGTLFFSLLAAGIFCFAAVPAQIVGGEWAVIGAATMAKFAVCFSYCCIYLLAGESYPTTLRGLGTGFSSAAGEMGNVFMPYIVHSAVVYEMLPMIILGAMSVAGAFGCLFLPETKDQYLPETVDEAEKQGLVRMETFKKNLATFFFWTRKQQSSRNINADNSN